MGVAGEMIPPGDPQCACCSTDPVGSDPACMVPECGGGPPRIGRGRSTARSARPSLGPGASRPAPRPTACGGPWGARPRGLIVCASGRRHCARRSRSRSRRPKRSRPTRTARRRGWRSWCRTPRSRGGSARGLRPRPFQLTPPLGGDRRRYNAPTSNNLRPPWREPLARRTFRDTPAPTAMPEPERHQRLTGGANPIRAARPIEVRDGTPNPSRDQGPAKVQARFRAVVLHSSPPVATKKVAAKAVGARVDE